MVYHGRRRMHDRCTRTYHTKFVLWYRCSCGRYSLGRWRNHERRCTRGWCGPRCWFGGWSTVLQPCKSLISLGHAFRRGPKVRRYDRRRLCNATRCCSGSATRIDDVVDTGILSWHPRWRTGTRDKHVFTNSGRWYEGRRYCFDRWAAAVWLWMWKNSMDDGRDILMRRCGRGPRSCIQLQGSAIMFR